MARIFTALTSPADSSSAFLQEAGAGAKTFMDAQRQQEAEERAEAKEVRAVDAHKMDMEAARVGLAAKEMAASEAQAQLDAEGMQAKAEAESWLEKESTIKGYQDRGLLGGDFGAAMGNLVSGRAAAEARGEDTRSYDIAIVAERERMREKLEEVASTDRLGTMRQRLLIQAGGEDGMPSAEDQKAIEGMDEEEMQRTLEMLDKRESDEVQMGSTLGYFEQWLTGVMEDPSATPRLAGGRAALAEFGRQLEKYRRDMPLGIRTPEQLQEELEAMAWEVEQEIMEPWKKAKMQDKEKKFKLAAEASDARTLALRKDMTKLREEIVDYRNKRAEGGGGVGPAPATGKGAGPATEDKVAPDEGAAKRNELLEATQTPASDAVGAAAGGEAEAAVEEEPSAGGEAEVLDELIGRLDALLAMDDAIGGVGAPGAGGMLPGQAGGLMLGGGQVPGGVGAMADVPAFVGGGGGGPVADLRSSGLAGPPVGPGDPMAGVIDEAVGVGGEEGTQVLGGGRELLENVRGVIADPGAHGISSTDSKVVRRLGTLATMLERALEEQDVERVQELSQKIEEVVGGAVPLEGERGVRVPGGPHDQMDAMRSEGESKRAAEGRTTRALGEGGGAGGGSAGGVDRGVGEEERLKAEAVERARVILEGRAAASGRTDRAMSEGAGGGGSGGARRDSGVRGEDVAGEMARGARGEHPLHGQGGEVTVEEMWARLVDLWALEEGGLKEGSEEAAAAEELLVVLGRSVRMAKVALLKRVRAAAKKRRAGEEVRVPRFK